MDFDFEGFDNDFGQDDCGGFDDNFSQNNSYSIDFNILVSKYILLFLLVSINSWNILLSNQISSFFSM